MKQLFLALIVSLASADAVFAQTEATNDEIIAATEDYLRVANRAVESLDRRGLNFGQKALVIENAANRIYNLSVWAVDDDVVAYYLDSADRMYSVAMMYRNVGQAAGIANANRNDFRYYWAYWTNNYGGHTARLVAAQDANFFVSEQKRQIYRGRAELMLKLYDAYNYQF